MKVLIISSNTLPFSPSGPAYVAGAALKAGHRVEVFDCLFSKDVPRELDEHLTRFNPDVIGISIRLVTGDIIDESAEFKTKRFDVRPDIKGLVDRIKQSSAAQIVLGGPGFNYYGRDWLEYLDLDYGIRGEAEFAFPLYLERLAEGGDIYAVPGCIYRKDGRFHKVPRELIEDLDTTALPAYQLFDLDQYFEHNISAAIFTKRGCAFGCTFCPYRSLEGARYRLKSPTRVVDEIKHIQKAKKPKRFSFCDNSFNVPKKHAEAICQELIDRKLGVRWITGALKPLGVTDDFCRLLKEAGCEHVNLAVETASKTMLKKMGRGYKPERIRQALSSLIKSDIPFGISLMFGAPGETPETIAETLDFIDSFQMPLETWVTIGICLWTHHQKVLNDARAEGQLKDDRELFDGAYYMSPELPRDYMLELIESLGARENYTVQVNKPYAGFTPSAPTL
ncbi:MAG: radical SAM protein [Anaerolineales bacterium]|nr:MAG: radical SAM protein [Anaerolineales bacterium]